MTTATSATTDEVDWVLDLFDKLTGEYRQFGQPEGAVSDEQVKQLRAKAESEIRKRWGGQAIYFRKYNVKDRAARDEAVRDDVLLGKTYRQTARDHDMAESRVRWIMRKDSA
jgi:Mor family transcriptional regulator